MAWYWYAIASVILVSDRFISSIQKKDAPTI